MYLVSSSLILGLFFCLEFPTQGVAHPPTRIFLVTKTMSSAQAQICLDLYTIFPFPAVPSGAMFKATVNNVDDTAS